MAQTREPRVASSDALLQFGKGALGCEFGVVTSNPIKEVIIHYAMDGFLMPPTLWWLMPICQTALWNENRRTPSSCILARR